MENQIRVTAVVAKDGSFLVIKRSQDDEFGEKTWTLPGGRVEVGENPEDAVKREVKEETDLFVDTVKPISTWSGIKDDVWAVGICFLCRYIEGKVKLTKEHSDFMFIDFKEIENSPVEEWVKVNARKAMKELSGREEI